MTPYGKDRALVFTNALFEHDKTRLVKELNEIIDANVPLTKSRYLAFRFKGLLYVYNSIKTGALLKQDVAPLHSSLITKFEAFLEDELQVSTDEIMISQFLFVLLKQATNMQETLDMLPDSIRKLMPGYTNEKRLRHFYSYHSPAVIAQSTKMEQKILSYAAAKLFY